MAVGGGTCFNRVFLLNNIPYDHDLFEGARMPAKIFLLRYSAQAISLLVRDQSRLPDAHVNVSFPVHGDLICFDLSPVCRLRCQDTIEANSQRT